MTSYSKRDIRAADILAVILFSIGLILLGLAIFETATQPKVAIDPRAGGVVRVLWFFAGTFTLMGGALGLKVRELARNGGREPVAYEGVPE